jgi:hypothetical protein
MIALVSNLQSEQNIEAHGIVCDAYCAMYEPAAQLEIELKFGREELRSWESCSGCG